ncbi:MAG: YciI family protein [Micromonosporaceae bacterium]|nr:YciI family protein [Micromonosporaceae bacterium]
MKYVILIYSNPASREIWDSFSGEQKTAGFAVYAALGEELAASGELIVSEALADSSLTTRIPAQEGQALTTDGPFAELKEQLAGFFLIECESAERATEIAKKVPEAPLGLVEVRPVLDLSGLEM